MSVSAQIAHRSAMTASVHPARHPLAFVTDSPRTKVIIQIPCLNEASTLGTSLRALPRELPGVDRIEWLVIDDGSTDGTVEVARAAGVDHIVRLRRNQGLARAFMAGLDACLRLGADIIVNTDADNQYCADDIPKLLEPILQGRAEIVIGARPVQEIQHFSPVKKALQALGSRVVRWASHTDIPDAPSGFRAISREAAMRLHVFSDYTYTLETIIQAGQRGIPIVSVPIRVNAELRPSRLVKSLWSYVQRSIFTIFRIFVTYRPLRFFMTLGLLAFASGFLIGVRFLYFFLIGDGRGHVQSLILGALLMGGGAFTCLVGVLADLIAVNRMLLEDVSYRLRRIDVGFRLPVQGDGS
jgi:glycosyltransferase involved in cell wall biosynthesis